MLQRGQNSTLNHTEHRFVANSICNYGSRASFACFHLTAVSQCEHHASVQINDQMVFFNQLRSNKAVAGTTIHQSYNIKQLGQLAPFTTG